MAYRLDNLLNARPPESTDITLWTYQAPSGTIHSLGYL